MKKVKALITAALLVSAAAIHIAVPVHAAPTTIWPATAVPASLDSGPDTAVELGVTFRSNTNGYITGIRFYKGPNNTGTHLGNLWTGTGTLLARATFTNETASGWQQVNFSTPVAISANTNYVASYYTTNGHFAVTQNYFASTGVTNGPLTAPANGGGVLNGPYTYGSTSAFPRSTYLSSNYWVDVVFDTVSTQPPPPSSSSCTIWPATTVPANVDSGPDTGVELGVTFRSNTNGYITALRFYKGPNNTGTTHVGNLWTNTGARLATATFTNETASGWQQVNFSTPVAITANTNYVASYYTTNGHFAATQDYFATVGVTNGPLTAPANAAGVLNGPYTYGSSSAFPRSTYRSSNYWVDVVFSTTTGGGGGTPDTPPTITTTTLPGGTQSATYSASLAASGGTTPYTWSLSSGSLPTGLSLSSSGTISGTPTTVGSFSFTVQVRDGAGSTASRTLSINVSPAATADPRSLTGEWSPVFSWNGQVGIHMHVLPTGKVLSWQDDNNANYYVNGTRGPDKTTAQVWDVATGTFVNVDNSNTDLFCSGHSFLPDGRLLVAGGHEQANTDGSVDTNIFDPSLGIWRTAAPMSAGRWYASACTLANGEVLAVAGLGHVGNPDVPEVWRTDGTGWRMLSGAEIHLPYYPFLHLAPDGRVFISGPLTTSFYMDTSGNGSLVQGPLTNFANTRVEGTGVMYDVGKLLIVGGSDPPTATAEVIDLLSNNPTWRFVDSMAYARRHFDATLLPDGKVLVTGGTSSPGYNNAAGAVHAAEIWDPVSEKWSTQASMQVNRLYHSSTLLLPDGRILTAGGGRPAAAGEDPYSEHDDAQIFSPPYLFKGARPVITSAPNAVTYNGQPFFVQTPDAANITAVNWVRLSSVTHGHNMNQRFNRLSFSMTAGGLNVNAPTDNKVCPPGDYILFILNGNGVPSVGRIMRIN